MKRPPFCPNPKCSNHHYQAAEAAGVFWIRKGSYTTQVSGEVQRFRCRLCGRGFSERTTSIDYFAKKALDYPEIHRATCASESVSSIARHLGCSVASVVNRQDRLGRNCLAMQARLLEGHRLEEDLVADGFESFDRSQYVPNALNILGVYPHWQYVLRGALIILAVLLGYYSSRRTASVKKIATPATKPATGEQELPRAGS